MKILEKIGLVVNSNIHELLDAVIDLNSPAVIKEQVRRLERATDAIGTQVAVATGQVNVIDNEISQIEKSLATLQVRIDKILSDDDDTNDVNAVPMQVQATSLEKRLAGKKEERTTAAATAKSLRDTQVKVKAKLSALTARISELERLNKATKAKEAAANVLKNAKDLSNIDASMSVDNFERDLRARAATADARLNEALGDSDDAGDNDFKIEDAKEALQKRKDELKTSRGSSSSAA